MIQQPRMFVIGAGLSGLACAIGLAERGASVTVLESSGHAGGRCRSYFDDTLGTEIDNGNHLLLSGNRSVARYLNTIGAADALVGPERAEIPFLDLANGDTWTLRPGAALWPWWLAKDRGVPGSRALSWLRVLRLSAARQDATVADALDDGGVLFRRLWRPLAVAALNTECEQASARLLWALVRNTLGRGEAACRPRIARLGLGRAFVEPALAWLGARGANILFNRRVRVIEIADGRVVAIVDGRERHELGDADQVILCLPPAATGDLLPGLTVPTAARAIVNVHFRVPQTASLPRLVGLVGGTAEWVFYRSDMASVTISAADRVAGEGAEVIASRVWPEVVRALMSIGTRVPEQMPVYRVVKERRATFAQTPEMESYRAEARTPLANLFLAGDWTRTGLPATIEGAIQSGFQAATLALNLRTG
jgi:squalene-associated FAD-dependent desaturase